MTELFSLWHQNMRIIHFYLYWAWGNSGTGRQWFAQCSRCVNHWVRAVWLVVPMWLLAQPEDKVHRDIFPYLIHDYFSSKQKRGEKSHNPPTNPLGSIAFNVVQYPDPRTQEPLQPCCEQQRLYSVRGINSQKALGLNKYSWLLQ